jgi:AcrR family transcriptional regulator
VKPERRVGAEGSPRRELILDTTQRLMVDEGYAAVSTRRVAKEAGLTSALVHYYFPATDDLLLAVYRRAHARTLEALARALVAPHPLEAVWKVNMDPVHTALAAELAALANHRKVVSAEVAKTVAGIRKMQTAALATVMEAHPDQDDAGLSAEALVLLAAAISRTLSLERAHGVTLGHAELEAAVQAWLRRFRRGGESR